MPKFEKMGAILSSRKKLTTTEIWDNAFFKLRFHMAVDISKSKKPISFGFGINIEKEFEDFFRNVCKMRGLAEDHGSNFLLSEPLFTNGIFDQAGRWLKKCKLVSKGTELIGAEVKLEEGNVYLHRLDDKRIRIDDDVCIKLSKRDVEMFMAATKVISLQIHQMAQWCKSEISLIRDTDNELEKLFHN